MCFFLSNIHKVIFRRRLHPKIKRKCKFKGDNNPAGLNKISQLIIKAEFIKNDKLGLLFSCDHFVGCRSPPRVLRFLDFKILKWRTSSWINMRQNTLW